MAELYWIPLVLSNLLAISLLFGCWRWPSIGAMIYSLIFLAAGIFNWYTALSEPQLYVQGYGELAVFPFYQEFIQGWFAEHVVLVVGLIASGQLFISAGLWLKGKLFLPAVWGGILFFLGITPLGMGSAFPAPVIMAASMAVLWYRLRKD